MKIFKKVKEWLLSGVQEELNNAEARAQYWKKESAELDELNREQQEVVRKLKKDLEEEKQKSSELQDEIDIQKSKAANYLSLYLTEMEKNLPDA